MANPEVVNAADPEQVKRAGKLEKQRAERQRDLARIMLSTPEGREFCWNQLETLGVYRSVFETSSRIYYLAGRQDYGHELMALLATADEDAYDLMTREARARAAAAARSRDAAFTKSTEEQKA